MRDIWKLVWKLLVIAVIAGLALGFTNELTADAIAEQVAAEAVAARAKVLPQAAEFVSTDVVQNDGGVVEAFVGKDANGVVGMTAKVKGKGYGGEIEVTVGMDVNGVVTGISVGGANFSETVGLGAKSKDAAFTDQFAGKEAPLTLKEDIIPITSATITSTAVTNAVNDGCDYMKAQLESAGNIG